ncbi:hypothetical protein [Parafrankia sp. EUN1f]|uniref:hypothetical protein n=1 Tax=Parafrankia sp. EUN1f TaxID=102897 RepID=UPI0001C44B05|nr:hypothetical protein [Parafrankia sp. EUN1f]EFC82945.1 hypothetical protein FrEUN1fDRAFT_3965 [Parafrankia sp. EUN1f]
MAEISRAQIESIVTKVTEEFAQEAQVNEREALRVSDFSEHAATLNKIGGDSAWSISYSTSAAEIAGTDVLRSQANNTAWSISYSTSSSSINEIAVQPTEVAVQPVVDSVVEQ